MLFITRHIVIKRVYCIDAHPLLHRPLVTHLLVTHLVLRWSTFSSWSDLLLSSRFVLVQHCHNKGCLLIQTLHTLPHVIIIFYDTRYVTLVQPTGDTSARYILWVGCIMLQDIMSTSAWYLYVYYIMHSCAIGCNGHECMVSMGVILCTCAHCVM